MSLGSSGPRKRKFTKYTPTTKKSSNAYDRKFVQNLIDHRIYLDNRSREPENMEEITAWLARPRRSLSPSQFSDVAFKRFVADNAAATDEDNVMMDAIPAITGPKPNLGLSARNTIFGNLNALTDGSLASAKPDLYCGARPEQLNRQTRRELAGYIVPSAQEEKPMAPSFFLEVKGPDGTPSVAVRQACYVGALGARGIHMLQSYGKSEQKDELFYDNKAYTITSIYHFGCLKIFAVHPTLSVENSPEYHMTQLNAWAMTGDRDTFCKGAAALRNARDFAREQCDKFIVIANNKAAQLSAERSKVKIPSEEQVPSIGMAQGQKSETSSDE
jgi:hypothetical protein